MTDAAVAALRAQIVELIKANVAHGQREPLLAALQPVLANLDALTAERDLAVAHDRQPYPTASRRALEEQVAKLERELKGCRASNASFVEAFNDAGDAQAQRKQAEALLTTLEAALKDELLGQEGPAVLTGADGAPTMTPREAQLAEALRTYGKHKLTCDQFVCVCGYRFTYSRGRHTNSCVGRTRKPCSCGFDDACNPKNCGFTDALAGVDQDGAGGSLPDTRSRQDTSPVGDAFLSSLPAPSPSLADQVRAVAMEMGTVLTVLQRPTRALSADEQDQVRMLTKWRDKLTAITGAPQP